MVDVPKVAAHYAVSALFENGVLSNRVYCYDVQKEDHRVMREGRSRMGVGRIQVTSTITGATELLTFAVLHLGGQNVVGGVRPFRSDEAYRKTIQEMATAFHRVDFAELIRTMDASFGAGAYSLRLLFRDEQRRIANLLLEDAMAEAEGLYRSFYRSHSSLVRSLNELGIPLPRRFQMAVDFTLNSELRAALAADQPDMVRIDELLEEVRLTGVDLDKVALEFVLRRNLERSARRWQEAPGDLSRLRPVTGLVEAAHRMPFSVNVWYPQNVCVFAIGQVYTAKKVAANSGDKPAADWVTTFRQLAAGLGVRPPD
jgi:hypothetical protein